MRAPSVSFSVNGQTHSLALPPRLSDDQDSVFVVGLPKAGSTLLNRIMQPICKRAGLVPFSLHNELRRLGLSEARFPDNLGALYTARGYAYVGFRSLTPKDRFPDFAGGRTVFLVRDPRDMAVSRYFSEAFSHRPPGDKIDSALADSFAARRDALQTTRIDDYVLDTAPSIVRYFLSTRDELARISHRTWRYEDVIFDKLAWTREMVAYLGLDVPQPLIAQVVERNNVMPSAEREAEHVRKVTPGDHRDKLLPATIDRLNDAFAEILTEYGYDRP